MTRDARQGYEAGYEAGVAAEEQQKPQTYHNGWAAGYIVGRASMDTQAQEAPTRSAKSKASMAKKVVKAGYQKARRQAQSQ